MNKSIAIGIALAAATFASGAFAQSYTVEPRHSHISWAVTHLGVSTYRGKLNKTSGKVVLDAAGKGGMVDITIDPTGLLSGDERLDKHLQAEDFFNPAFLTTLARFRALVFVMVAGQQLKEELQAKYEKLMQEAFELSKSNRSASDQKYAEAQEVQDELSKLD